MGKRKQQKSDCVCDHPGHCVCLPPAAVTWVPDTRPRQDNPDPNEAYRLDLELAAKFRELVELAATDPHLPGRLREAVAELTDEARADVVALQDELDGVKDEWYSPDRYDEDIASITKDWQTTMAERDDLKAKLDTLTDELADLCLENDRLRSMLTLIQADGC
jgi:chromosome segregation ATPase